MRKENLSLFPNGPVHAAIFIDDSAVVNQTDGHWTMTGSLKTLIMKPLHSFNTAIIPTFDLDTSCAAVMTCVSSQMGCAKRTQSLTTGALGFSFVAHIIFSAVFFFFFFNLFGLVSDNLPPFVYPAKSSIRCSTHEK